MSLDNTAADCRIEDYPDNIKWPGAVNYMESLGAVVACGGQYLEETSKCFAFDGTSWTPLPDSTQRHCYSDSHNLIVEQGWWVTGRLAARDGGCAAEWTSEIFTGDEWIPGPQHPTGYSLYPCLAEVNSTHSLLTGGDPFSTNCGIYDWTAGAWAESTELNEGRYGHGCAVLEDQGVLVAGGSDGTNFVYSGELYDPETGIWTPQPGLPQDRDPVNAVLLPRHSGTVVALFYGQDQVYQRLEDGTWSAMEGVVLPNIFGGVYHHDAAALVPADFANGYGCM